MRPPLAAMSSSIRSAIQPRVERVRAVGGDGSQRLAEIREDDAIAGGPLAAARLAVRRDGRGESAHRAGHFAVQAARERGRHREALLGQLGGRQDDVLPRQLAELPVRARHAAHGARHAGRQIARRRERSIDVAVLADVHRRRRLARRGLAVVEGRGVAVRLCGRP